MKKLINKAKKIYRIIFPENVNSDEFFVKTLKMTPSFLSLQRNKNIYLLELSSGLKLAIRNKEHSDFDVYRQIFVNHEYGIFSNLVNYNFKKEGLIIIDAGANVGYTSLYFSRLFKSCKIFAIEPSPDNFELLRANMEMNSLDVKLYNNALAEVEGKKFEIGNDFRDSKDWSITTNESINGEIDGITIQQIINENEIQYISILKIDIEGAERFLFRSGVDLAYLKITKLIAIEIHDEFYIREKINSILQVNGFILFTTGELTIGINKWLHK